MGRRKLRRVAIVDTVRGSIARVTIGGETVVGIDAATVMTERATGLKSAREDQGRDQETANRTASARTNIVRARAQGNTGGIDREVKSDDGMRTGTEGHVTTIATTKEPRVRGARTDVVLIAVEADRGRHTSIQGHDERAKSDSR